MYMYMKAHEIGSVLNVPTEDWLVSCAVKHMHHASAITPPVPLGGALYPLTAESLLKGPRF